MISSYCRPSSRPPELVDLSRDEEQLSNMRQQQPHQGKEVLFAGDHPDNASPRSFTNAGVFFGMRDNSPKTRTEAAAFDVDVDREHDDAMMAEAAPVSKVGGANEGEGRDQDEEEEESPAEVAMLLASVASIATKEINADPPIMTALADAFPRFPDLASSLSHESVEGMGAGGAAFASARLRPCAIDEDAMAMGDEAKAEQEPLPKEDPKEKEVEDPPADPPALMHFDHKKMRSVSVDFDNKKMRCMSEDFPEPMRRELEAAPVPPSPSHRDEQEAIPLLLQWRNLRGESTSPPHQQHHINAGIFSTPPPSPLVSGRRHPAHSNVMVPNSEFRRTGSGPSPSSRVTVHHHNRNNRPRSISLAEGSIMQVPVLDLAAVPATEGGVGGANNENNNKPKKLILRRKFSWKNYPELEEFLIANREEYLRHSTLNYTMQQKKYNNCLTERMIKLASEHGYVFDESEFSFVTVRDRIRCYYKSYVQSMKKRGVVIGYAARKAGLVTEAELEESAHTSGKIYVPRN